VTPPGLLAAPVAFLEAVAWLALAELPPVLLEPPDHCPNDPTIGSI
jgi:hypothetical protein